MKSLHILAEIPIWSRFWNLEASLHVSNGVNTISKYKKTHTPRCSLPSEHLSVVHKFWNAISKHKVKNNVFEAAFCNSRDHADKFPKFLCKI